MKSFGFVPPNPKDVERFCERICLTCSFYHKATNGCCGGVFVKHRDKKACKTWDMSFEEYNRQIEISRAEYEAALKNENRIVE